MEPVLLVGAGQELPPVLQDVQDLLLPGLPQAFALLRKIRGVQDKVSRQDSVLHKPQILDILRCPGLP